MLVPVTAQRLAASFDLSRADNYAKSSDPSDIATYVSRRRTNIDAATYVAWALWTLPSDVALRDALNAFWWFRDLLPFPLTWNITAWGDPADTLESNVTDYYFVLRHSGAFKASPAARHGRVEDALFVTSAVGIGPTDSVDDWRERSLQGHRAIIQYARQYGLLTIDDFKSIVDVSIRTPPSRAIGYANEVLLPFGIQTRLVSRHDPVDLLGEQFVTFVPHDSVGDWRFVYDRLIRSHTAGASPRDHLPTSCPPSNTGPSEEECFRRLVYLRLPRLFRYYREHREVGLPPYEQRSLRWP